MDFTFRKPLEHGSRARAFRAPIVFFYDSFCSLLSVKIPFKVSHRCVETAVLVMPQQISPPKKHTGGTYRGLLASVYLKINWSFKTSRNNLHQRGIRLSVTRNHHVSYRRQNEVLCLTEHVLCGTSVQSYSRPSAISFSSAVLDLNRIGTDKVLP